MASIALPSQLGNEVVDLDGVVDPSSPASRASVPPLPQPPPFTTIWPHELPVCCPVRQKKQRQWIGPTGVNQSSKCSQKRVSLSPRTQAKAESKCLLIQQTSDC